MPGGTYTLLVAMPERTTITVGALGEHTFDRGWYAYTGSALGTGGFARVERHRAVDDGENDTRHWHIDYLLGHPTSRIAAVARTADADVECAVAGALPGQPVPEFGASDCNCDTHLAYDTDRERLWRAVRGAHRAFAP